MQVLDLHAGLREECGQILRHLLGQRGDQDPASKRDLLVDLGSEVIDLPSSRSHLDERVEQSGRTDDLLHDLVGMFELIGPRRGADEDRLRDHLEELLEPERTVVCRRRQTKSMLDEDLLAGAVASELPVELRDGDVALVDDDQQITREEVDQGIGALTCGSAVEVPAVVFDTSADTGLREHLEIVLGAGPKSLRLEQLPLRLAASPLRPPRNGWRRR